MQHNVQHRRASASLSLMRQHDRITSAVQFPPNVLGNNALS